MSEMNPRPTDAELKAGLSREGFLAPEMEAYRPTIVAIHGEWFDFGRRLNQMAVNAWLAHPITKAGQLVGDPEPVSVRLHARAMDSFQAAYLLLERGLAIEAGTLNRSIYEAALWLGYLAKSPEQAAADFYTDDLHGQRGRLRAAHKYEPDAKTKARAAAVLLEMDAAIGDRGQPLKPEQLAEKAGLAPFYPKLRGLSGMAAHASESSVSHYLQIYSDGTAGHILGPEIDGLPYRLAECCQALAMATDAFIKFNSDKRHRVSLNELVAELSALTAQLPPRERPPRKPPPKRRRSRTP